MSLVIKYAVTAFLIVLVSEVAKRSDKFGAFIASLPFVTLMVMVWLHVEKQGAQKIGNHAYYTFWYVLPTLPMFLVMPWLLGRGIQFWLALGLCVLVTLACFALTAVLAKCFGIDLIP